ncbi:MAG: hypothetical protein ACHQUC_10215, partial [Chlamydiales bacterium]
VHIPNIERFAIGDPRGFGTVSDAEVISLRALRKQLQTGRAAFDETSVQKMVSNQSSNRLALHLNHVLKNEYVQQQLHNLNKFTVPTKMERRVLKALGYDVKRYQDKIMMKKCMKTALESRYDELVDTSATLLELKDNIKQFVQQCRLKFAQVPDTHVRRIQTLINRSTEFQKNALARAEELVRNDDYTIGITHAKIREFIEELLFCGRYNFAKNIWERFIGNQKETILHMLNNPSDGEWNYWLDSFKQHCERSSLPKSAVIEIRRQVNFFHEADQWLVINASQHQNSNAILLNGVCFGQCIRLAAQEQDNPDIDDEELLESCNILAADRFTQATSLTAILLYKNALADDLLKADQMPKESINLVILNEVLRVVNKDKIGKLLFTIDEDDLLKKPSDSISDSNDTIVETFKQKLEVNKENLKVSNGVILLELEGPNHMIYMRVDHERRIYRLYDPNIGRLRFPDTETQLIFLKKLFNACYSKITGICTVQLLPTIDYSFTRL